MGRRRERDISRACACVSACGVGEVEWEEEERERESRSPARLSTGLTGGVSSPGRDPPGEGAAGEGADPGGDTVVQARPCSPADRPSRSPRAARPPGNSVKASSKNADGPVGDPWSDAGGDGLSAVDPRPSPRPIIGTGLLWLPPPWPSSPNPMDRTRGESGPGLELCVFAPWVSRPSPMGKVCDLGDMESEPEFGHDPFPLVSRPNPMVRRFWRGEEEEEEEEDMGGEDPVGPRRSSALWMK